MNFMSFTCFSITFIVLQAVEIITDNFSFVSQFKGGESTTTYHFKTLVPSVAAGAIIGKGGETIASLQRDAGARVKMSKSHDFYPGNYFVFNS